MSMRLERKAAAQRYNEYWLSRGQYKTRTFTRLFSGGTENILSPSFSRPALNPGSQRLADTLTDSGWTLRVRDGLEILTQGKAPLSYKMQNDALNHFKLEDAYPMWIGSHHVPMRLLYGFAAWFDLQHPIHETISLPVLYTIVPTRANFKRNRALRSDVTSELLDMLEENTWDHSPYMTLPDHLALSSARYRWVGSRE